MFFTTSQAGEPGPDVGRGAAPLKDAYDLEALQGMDAIVTCQGGDYTSRSILVCAPAVGPGTGLTRPRLCAWRRGSVIVLDPVNRDVIEAALRDGKRDFIGGNCTVSLMLMAIGGLFRAGLVEWVSAMTYQAASGAAGEEHARAPRPDGGPARRRGGALGKSSSAILEIDRRVTETMRERAFPWRVSGCPWRGV